jgi:hypothetical protein
MHGVRPDETEQQLFANHTLIIFIKQLPVNFIGANTLTINVLLTSSTVNSLKYLLTVYIPALLTTEPIMILSGLLIKLTLRSRLSNRIAI